MELEEKITKYLDESINCIKDLENKKDQIKKIILILEDAKKQKKKVFLLGNGGSASTASHLVCDFNKFRGLKAIALTDSLSLITAWSNDEDYSIIFKKQLQTLAEPGDIILGFSGSGKSSNVIKAFKYANEIGCKTIAFTGFDGGILKDIADECIIAEVDNMQHSEDMHVLLGHMIAFLMEDN